MSTRDALRIIERESDVSAGIRGRAALAVLADAEREVAAFRALKEAWEGPCSESDWLEFCQDFEWEVSAPSPSAPAKPPPR